MTEDQLEQEALGWLGDVGYAVAHGPDIAPDGPSPERANYREVVLAGRLRAAMDAAIELVLEQAKALGESWA